MDPDTAKVEAPVMAIKVTMYKGGGTAIGILIQHGVCDMEAIFSFVHGWSTVFRGEAIVPNVLNYERYMHFEIDDPLAEPDVENLKDLDQVGYVRFASVYRNFREAKDFEDFVENLGDLEAAAD